MDFEGRGRMKKLYKITMPIAGSAYGEVEAESENEALELFYDLDQGEMEIQWEYYETLCGGNVLYTPWNKVEVEEEELEGDRDGD